MGKREQTARKGSPRRAPAVRLTPELARAWLVTVVNPILRGMRRDTVLLKDKNWTWRYVNGQCEFLWPVAWYVGPAYQDNFSAFGEFYRQAAETIQRRDRTLAELVARCNEAYRSLIESNEFLAAVQDAESLAVQKGIDLEAARGAVPANEWPRLLGQYVINNVRAVPDYYTSAAFWKEAGEQLLRVRNSEHLAAQFDRLERIGAELLDATEGVETALVSIRDTYLRKFGLPPNPLTEPGDAGE